MTTSHGRPDLLGRSSETRGGEVFYRFANGLTIKTEVFDKADRLRILPLGSPQGGLMNHLLNFPDVVRGKCVFEPFAGSGALGFMALKIGAERVDFLDINHRAPAFQRDNAAQNQFPSSRFRSIEGDIATFSPRSKYDLILANPPFVPTPDGIDGTITSNGGPEGNRLVEILLARLEEFLKPDGEALIYVFQLVDRQGPLLLNLISRYIDRRSVELTPAQRLPIHFDAYCRAYSQLFPEAAEAIAGWKSRLAAKHGDGLTLCHYVVCVGPRAREETSCVIRENFAEKFGEDFLVPSDDPNALSFGRVLENVVPPEGRA
jgi:SAM-dependent methyltransferase